MEKGISPFISTVLLLVIAISAISISINIFRTTAEKAYESSSIYEAERNLQILNELIKEVASEGVGSLRNVIITVSDGRYKLINASGNFNGAIVYKLELKQSPFPSSMFQKIGNLKYSTSISTAGLIGYWNLNEGNGTFVKDLSGYENNGFVYNGEEICASPPMNEDCPKWVESKYVRGLKLDGENEFVKVEDKNLPLNSSFTVSVVFSYQKKTSPENSTILSKSFGSEANDTFSFLIDNANNLFVRVGNGSEFQFLSSGSEIEEGKFYEAVLIFDSEKNQYKLYLNGAEKSSLNVPSGWKPAQHDGALYFGAWQNQDWFNGTVDEVKIYSRSLSLEEVKEMSSPSNFQVVLEYRKIVLVGELNIGKGRQKICIQKIGESNNSPAVKIEAC